MANDGEGVRAEKVDGGWKNWRVGRSKERE